MAVFRAHSWRNAAATADVQLMLPDSAGITWRGDGGRVDDGPCLAMAAGAVANVEDDESGVGRYSGMIARIPGTIGADGVVLMEIAGPKVGGVRTGAHAALLARSDRTLGVYHGRSVADPLLWAVPGVVLPEDWFHLDWSVNGASQTAGVTEVRYNGVSAGTQGGLDTINDALAANWSGAALRWGGGAAHDTSEPWFLGSVYAIRPSGVTNNVLLGNFDVVNLRPVGDGFYQEGAVGGAGVFAGRWDRVNDVPHDGDGSYIADPSGASTAMANKNTFLMEALPASVGQAFAVCLHYVQNAPTGTLSYNGLARNGATDLQGGATPNQLPPASATYRALRAVLNSVPGGTGWTPAQVNGTEFGWARLNTNNTTPNRWTQMTADVIVGYPPAPSKGGTRVHGWNP